MIGAHRGKKEEHLPEGQILWISPDILDWQSSAPSALPCTVDWKAHYNPWEHANGSLTANASEQDRACALFQLRRALEFRDTALTNIYSLDKVPGFGKAAYPRIFSDLKIVLPVMRKKLIDLRNEVSHDYMKEPPDVSRCHEFAEFTWYFLKSTDHMLSSPIGSLNFQDAEQDRSSLEIHVDPGTWSMHVDGALHAKFVSLNKVDDGVQVIVNRAYLYDDFVYFFGSACTMSRNTMLRFLLLYFGTIY